MASKFTDFLSALGIAPKSLDTAQSTQDSAKQILGEIRELFAAAEIDLDTLLAAGPNALADYIESAVLDGCSGAAEEVEAFKAAAEASAASANEFKAKLDAATADNAAILGSLVAKGIKPEDGKPLAESLPAAIDARINIKAQELVAATGGRLLDDTVSTDVTKAEGKVAKLQGIKAVEAIFAAGLAARKAK